ncbi:Ubiquitin carboxyl-terminal hydrolase 34 [Lachnellula cervina]|uniref:Ubiquitin carboxyl-terminal hydrolase 34 n=1 Tax=Lachnellula cervina TaxID=1316786 RepID=A0A7D8ULP2_9HELO|nr:Ubiquitin carboxyl-terminal hydrolase 34 [Lachnellula cervina]
MDREAAELSRERAVSSEPCSTRPNPFEEPVSSSRKRQRVSRPDSRSRSVDTARYSDRAPDSSSLREDSTNPDSEPPHLPQTPTRMPSEGPPPPEPTSSRVTINLRTVRPLGSIPSSPPSPSRMVNSRENMATRASVESESDALSTIPAIETPSSSPSERRSPSVEVITVSEDGGDFGSRSPPVAILDGDIVITNPMVEFPFLDDQSLVDAVGSLKNYMQFDECTNEDGFCRFRDWMESYLNYASDYRTFHESYLKHRDFWIAFPQIIWALSYRSKFFGNWLQNRRDGRQAVTEMFSQFARLAGRFVGMDVKTLTYHAQKDDTDEIPDLGSYPMMKAYAWLLKKDETQHIGRNLDTHYRWSWDETALLMTTSFQEEGGSLPNLTDLVKGQILLIPKVPRIIDKLVEPCRLAVKIVADASKVVEQPTHQEWALNAREQISQGFDFFQVMALGLEHIIEKHVTYLTPDAAHCYLSSLSSILRNALVSDSEATEDMTERYRAEHSELPLKMLPKIISVDWRFTILRKLITSTQMQLRVVGVTTMCTDLLNLYNTHKDAAEPPRNPLLFHYAQFILENKLVEYIVGIGSHPEIINESNSIMGFLIATKTYPPELTDLIWQTVMTSQDPRVVEAILRMVRQVVNLFDYRGLLRMCEKTCELPIEAFTLPMREFYEILLRHFVNKGAMEGVQYIDAPPYDLCIRLIRESSIITPEAPTGYPDIQAFAALRLRDLLGHGPATDVRKSIYQSCIDDVSSRTSTAAGSICVINTILTRNKLADLHTLTTQHGLTQLLVEELEQAVAGERHLSVMNSPASAARRELLLMIIINEPNTISEDLGRRLWDHLVGTKSRSVTDKNTSWSILNTAIKKSPSNAFITTCFRQYLPTLPPDCFTTGALDFARAYVSSWLGEISDDFSEDQSFESPAVQQIWQMILSAPPNTIDAAAIGTIVEVYVDSALISSIPRTRARDIHLALVGRCLKQLAEAASKLKAFSDETSSGDDDGMIIVASEAQFQEQERIFARSLAVLREFLKAYQSKPQFSVPKPRFPPPMVAKSDEGELLVVKYQSFDGNTHTEVRHLTLGKLNTPASLFTSLQKATGFQNYKVYSGGKEITSSEADVCPSIEELDLKGLVLVQRREDSDGPTSPSDGSRTTLEAEIVKHFDELWGYLSMHETVAQEIYYFLVQFPIYDRILRDFDSKKAYSEIFPRGQPFKSLYAVHALRQHINSQSNKVHTLQILLLVGDADMDKGAVDEAILTRAVSLIVSAISDPGVLRECANDELRDCLALHLIDCFVQLLKEPVLPSTIPPLLNEILLRRLLQMLEDSRLTRATQNSVHLVFRIFEAILEASLYSPELWKLFVSHLKDSSLLRDLLLEDPHSVTRKSIVKHITNKCSFTPSLAQVSSMDFAMAFWPLVSALIPETIVFPEQCDDTLTLSLSLFKKLAESDIHFFNLGDLMKQWGFLLLSHDSTEIVGNVESMDRVTNGLVNLLFCGASFAKASQQDLSCSSLGTELFRKHLFPPVNFTIPELDEIVVPRIPLLNPLTRHTMSETVFFLVKDDPTQYDEVLASLESLVIHDEATEDGTAKPPYCNLVLMLTTRLLGPYSYELPFLFDRSKSIRSHTGYVGLKNLSNTCYLNSLFTQLFMNVSFREFMLTAPVADGEDSQKLLSQTQILFSHMQNTLMRFVDPQALAGSIRTYEETNIDVNIQMDVDEFYNLLFDRWESQILAPDAKKQFRGFYGGQLVQQVKSKECPHISERLEPFSAIQCDIKGKTCLQESLQAYVDGEIMEGDNKYKCSTCDRHVDAVKRACLKDIPDNLIFHLKRFDFNLRTLQRSKINDHFLFPDKIDMRPFKVEHLMDSSAETPEDVFELVGVLVHAGTAESGHYYSFIRERPSTSEKDNWVEFNDDTVSSWDPNYMEAACFGGLESRGPMDSGTMAYEKSYSAYMLFYQRSSVVAAQKQALEESKSPSPVRLSLAPIFANHIAQENEILMRKYCLYDPSHVNFVSKMLLNIKKINGGQCSSSHNLEKRALFVALHHLDQVVSRTKELPDFVPFMLTIRQICNSCAECSSDYLEWFCNYPEGLRQLLVKNPESLVRGEIASSILSALNKVKSDVPYAYGISEDELGEEASGSHDPQLIYRLVKNLDRLWEIFHTNCRAWPEYFGLLASIASLGEPEATLLLDTGFLHRTLDIVNADPLLNLTPQFSRMLSIVNKRVNTRPVSYEAVITLLLKLLQTCDPSEKVVPDRSTRLDLALAAAPIPLTHSEYVQLTQHWTRSEAHICVEKLLHIHQNQLATRQIIITLLKWPMDFDSAIDFHIYQALLHGTRKGVTAYPCSPFLKAAVIYIEHSESDSTRALALIGHIARAASHVDNSEGRAFLHFFKDVMGLQSISGNSPVTLEQVYATCLDNVGNWAPSLLTHFDSGVRTETEQFLYDFIFANSPEESSDDSDDTIAAFEGVQKLAIDCLNYLHETYIRPRQTVVRATLVNIHEVISKALPFFEVLDADDPQGIKFFNMRDSIIPNLKKFIVEEADEEVSDWNGSEDDYGSSEPMGESITDICAPLADDDIQL